MSELNLIINADNEPQVESKIVELLKKHSISKEVYQYLEFANRSCLSCLGKYQIPYHPTFDLVEQNSNMIEFVGDVIERSQNVKRTKSQVIESPYGYEAMHLLNPLKDEFIMTKAKLEILKEKKINNQILDEKSEASILKAAVNEIKIGMRGLYSYLRSGSDKRSNFEASFNYHCHEFFKNYIASSYACFYPFLQIEDREDERQASQRFNKFLSDKLNAHFGWAYEQFYSYKYKKITTAEDYVTSLNMRVNLGESPYGFIDFSEEFSAENLRNNRIKALKKDDKNGKTDLLKRAIAVANSFGISSNGPVTSDILLELKEKNQNSTDEFYKRS